VANDDSDLMKEFEEFLNAKKQREEKDRSDEDFEVEIWDEKGRGVRTKRSHAKPFLQSLGIDTDDDSDGDDDDKDGDGKSRDTGKSKAKPTGKQSGNATASGVAAKYFTRQAKK